jgi:hypothetical protein
MTSSLLLHPLRGVAMAAALWCIASLPAAAQSTADAQAASKAAPHAPPNLNARLDFDFPQKKGGSQMTPFKVVLDTLVTEYRAAGNPVNVIYQENDGEKSGGKPAPEVMVAPMSLRQVTFMTAVRAVVSAATPQLGFQSTDDVVFIQGPSRKPEAPPPPSKDFAVFNIEEFLTREGKAKEKRKERVEILRKAVTMALALAGEETPKLELDDESGLLFVSGKSDSINIVGEVVNVATMAPPPPPAPPAPTAPDGAPRANP